MTDSLRRFALLLVALLAAAPFVASAAPTVPVRVRIIKGSRQGPATVDPKLRDLTAQLGALAYQRWEQVGEHSKELQPGKPVSVPLPDGATLEVILVETHGNSVTFDLRVPAQGTRSRLTIAKDQRIVQQVAPEKNGAALFATVRPWP
jgi:hypothetical protein